MGLPYIGFLFALGVGFVYYLYTEYQSNTAHREITYVENTRPRRRESTQPNEEYRAPRREGEATQRNGYNHRDRICTICIDPVRVVGEMRLNNCGHIFHLKCMRSYILGMNNQCSICPNCRKPLTQIELATLRA